MLSKRVAKTISIIQKELDDLRSLKVDLVGQIVGLMVLMGDLEENLADYTRGTLCGCTVEYLQKELRALGLRADKAFETILKGIMKQGKNSKPKTGSWNRIANYF